MSEDDYLLRASYLKEVPFPQLYESLLFSRKVSIRKIREYAIAFDRLTREMNRDGCLILDAMIEKKILGENWQRTMCSLMNKLAKKVLYDPKEIDLTVPEGDAQRKFEKLLSYPVKISLYNETENLEFLFSGKWLGQFIRGTNELLNQGSCFVGHRSFLSKMAI